MIIIGNSKEISLKKKKKTKLLKMDLITHMPFVLTKDAINISINKDHILMELFDSH